VNMLGPKSIPAPMAGSLPKVLLLTNDLTSPHAIREAIRRAGLTLILETIGSRSEFLSRLHSGQVDLDSGGNQWFRWIVGFRD
jgi:hypothetical protein